MHLNTKLYVRQRYICTLYIQGCCYFVGIYKLASAVFVFYYFMRTPCYHTLISKANRITYAASPCIYQYVSAIQCCHCTLYLRDIAAYNSNNQIADNHYIVQTHAFLKCKKVQSMHSVCRSKSTPFMNVPISCTLLKISMHCCYHICSCC
jgi:hypothetical protein